MKSTFKTPKRKNIEKNQKIEEFFAKNDASKHQVNMAREDNICEICLLSQSYISNQLVRCHFCECLVHQNCYGSDLLYKGEKVITNWVCLRCKEIARVNKEKNEISTTLNLSCCLFCPKKSGATKKITSDFWAHIVCVKLIPGIEFENELKESAILTSIIWIKEKCSICQLLQGQVVQCSFSNCHKKYHVTCAIQSGIIKTIHQENKSNLIFCPEHFSNEAYLKSEDNNKMSLSDNLPKSMGKKRIKVGKKMKNTIEKRMKTEEQTQLPRTRIEESVIDLIQEDFFELENKFFLFLERDMKRISDGLDTKLSIKQFIKLKEFVRSNINYLFDDNELI